MRLIEQLRWWATECDRTNFGCQARKLLIEAADALEKADAVPVVRCPECKYQEDCFSQIGHWSRDHILEQNNYEYHKIEFCSYGERKDGG